MITTETQTPADVTIEPQQPCAPANQFELTVLPERPAFDAETFVSTSW